MNPTLASLCLVLGLVTVPARAEPAGATGDISSKTADPRLPRVLVIGDSIKKNLEQEITILKRTGAKLIWCTATPVPNDNKGRFARRKGAAKEFNKKIDAVTPKMPICSRS